VVGRDRVDREHPTVNGNANGLDARTEAYYKPTRIVQSVWSPGPCVRTFIQEPR